MTTDKNTYKIKNISIYDGLGRLQTEAQPGITKAYTYDPAGNRATMTVSGLDNYTTTYSYDRNNRLLTETKDSGDALATVNYAYDANGNQLSKVGGTLSTSIGNPVVVGLSVLGQSEDSGLVAEINSYNAFNQLTQVQTARHNVSYAYKADGLRTSKTSNGQTTSFVWDGSNIAAENRGGDYQTYTRGIGLIRNGAGEYYLFDAHGDVVQMAGNGGVVREYRYDAFGNEVDPDENDTNPFRYCGEYWDGETGNIYLRARYYTPNTGRFITEDPVADGMNWYTYCINNPILYRDPTGTVVTIWDRMHCSSKEIKQLQENTKLWETGNAAQKAQAHASSEAIRNRYRVSNESGSANGYTIERITQIFKGSSSDNAFAGEVSITYTRMYTETQNKLLLNSASARVLHANGVTYNKMDIYVGQNDFFRNLTEFKTSTNHTQNTIEVSWSSIIDDGGLITTVMGSTVDFYYSNGTKQYVITVLNNVYDQINLDENRKSSGPTPDNYTSIIEVLQELSSESRSPRGNR